MLSEGHSIKIMDDCVKVRQHHLTTGELVHVIVSFQQEPEILSIKHK